jgi:cobalamin synthase
MCIIFVDNAYGCNGVFATFYYVIIAVIIIYYCNDRHISYMFTTCYSWRLQINNHE